MKKLFLLLLLLAFCSSAYSQDKPKRKHYFPIWTYHQDSITINGISLGLSTFDWHDRQTNTNGIKLELIGMGLPIFLFREPPTSSRHDLEKLKKTLPYKYKKTDFSEIINGLNISGMGSFCYCLTNGISLGLIGQYNNQINGFSASGFTNYAEVHNGIQISGAGNNTATMKGIQISSFNSVYRGKGVQLALIGNSADIEFKGIQIAVSNYADKIKGLQIGGINTAGAEFKGIQIGVFNRSSNLRGIQIGLWNVNQKRKMPIINWSFEK